jgi:hypothetical protein
MTPTAVASAPNSSRRLLLASPKGSKLLMAKARLRAGLAKEAVLLLLLLLLLLLPGTSKQVSWLGLAALTVGTALTMGPTAAAVTVMASAAWMMTAAVGAAAAALLAAAVPTSLRSLKQMMTMTHPMMLLTAVTAM